jgi:hypothetical protein
MHVTIYLTYAYTTCNDAARIKLTGVQPCVTEGKMSIKKFILIITFGIFMTPTLSNAKDFRVTSTVYFEHGKMVEPKVLLNAGDGDMLYCLSIFNLLLP